MSRIGATRARLGQERRATPGRPGSQARALGYPRAVLACETCGHRFDDASDRRPRSCPFDGGALVPTEDPLVGRSVAGRYVVLEALGRGGFGVVYRARHQVIGRDVAIKFLLPELASNPQTRERFLREARVANRIGHEHVIDIQDFGETSDGLVFLVMELLHGRALSAEIRAGTFPVGRALSVAIQSARALVRAHELDVVHRDIKPDNIFLVTEGSRRDFVKLLDFGLARMKGELRLTARGAVFGTPEYLSPEQARGAEATASSDLYALGCVIVEMLTGRPPFTGSVPDLLLKHLREPPPRLSSENPSVPAALDALVARLLAKSPTERPRDAVEVLDELTRIAGEVPRVRVSIEPDDLAKTFVRSAPEPPSREDGAGWAARVERFRALSRRAFGDEPPRSIVEQIEEFAAGVARLQRVEAELASAARDATAADGDDRAFRERVGRALDELARDASRTANERRRLVEERDALERDRSDAEAEVIRGLERLRATEPSATPLDDLAALLERIGAAASRRRVAGLRQTSSRDALLRAERALEDLRFQVEQLKGRLGAGAVEHEAARQRIRDRVAGLEREQLVAAELTSQRALVLARTFAAIDGASPATLERAEPSRETKP